MIKLKQLISETADSSIFSWWINPLGNEYPVNRHLTDSHSVWAKIHLKQLNIPHEKEGPSFTLSREGWIRATIRHGVLHFDYFLGRPPSQAVIKKLKLLAVERDILQLRDDIKDKSFNVDDSIVYEAEGELPH